MRRFRIFQTLALLCLAALAIAQARPSFVYVANRGSNDISAFRLDSATGALLAVKGSPFSAGTNPTELCVDAGGRFLYVANYYSDEISAFRIDPRTGALAQVQGSPFGCMSGPSGIAVDPKGRFLYLTNNSSDETRVLASPRDFVSAFTINPSNGFITMGMVMRAGKRPLIPAVEPGGRFVYVGNEGSNDISTFTSDPVTGKLSASGSAPFDTGASPRAIAFDPSGGFAYIAHEAGVSAFTIDPLNGDLVPTGSSPIAAGIQPSGIAVHPSGRFIYVANSGGASISAFSADRGGGLTAVHGQPFACGDSPRSIAVDPQGKFLYVTNGSASGGIYAYAIDPSGSLSEIRASPFAAGANPQGIVAVSPR